jgi:hypothetical protein
VVTVLFAWIKKEPRHTVMRVNLAEIPGTDIPDWGMMFAGTDH